MSTTTDKNNNSFNKVYEYFKESDIVFNGRFADYVDRMWTQNKILESSIRRLVDIYAISAIIGLRIGRSLEDDREGDQKRTVQIAQMSDIHQTLSAIMKLVLMLDESRGLSEEDRVRSAFRNPDSKEEHDANMELFTSYARGGIEYLYEKLVARVQDEDDIHTDNRINNLIALLRDPLTDLII